MQNYKIKGIVKFAGINDEKMSVSLKLTEERAEQITKALGLDPMKYEGTPVKESEDGEQYFKTSTKSTFNVKIYEQGEPTDIEIVDIGEDSEVELFFGVKVIEYKSKGKRKEYQVAFLKSVNIITLVAPDIFNPFDTDEIEEI